MFPGHQSTRLDGVVSPSESMLRLSFRICLERPSTRKKRKILEEKTTLLPYGYAPELIQDVVTSVADKMKGQLKQLEDERLALGRDTARWNSEIRKTTALIRPNETDSPAIARLADLQERIAHNERRINTVLSDIKKISNNLLTQQDVETAMTTFDPIWESMTLRDQIRLVQVVIKQVDYDGESGRVTITFNPIGIKKRAEHATKDLEEARA
jgi:site-specific DNA recombinase